jgi:hypothetical protein
MREPVKVLKNYGLVKGDTGGGRSRTYEAEDMRKLLKTQ